MPDIFHLRQNSSIELLNVSISSLYYAYVPAFQPFFRFLPPVLCNMDKFRSPMDLNILLALNSISSEIAPLTLLMLFAVWLLLLLLLLLMLRELLWRFIRGYFHSAL